MLMVFAWGGVWVVKAAADAHDARLVRCGGQDARRLVKKNIVFDLCCCFVTKSGFEW